MFKVDRIYSMTNFKMGVNDWYFQAREGNVGPYHSRQQAEIKLKEFIQTCINSGHTGGRQDIDIQVEIIPCTTTAY